MSNHTTTLTAADIKPGDKLAWRTWTGDEAVVTVTHVETFRISAANDGQWWEATCFHTLDEALASTPGLRIV